ncbi:hypothetical protein [Frigidibacter oleivorans]|uniref:hypothetical protein n=1 Tax=Frigidibacter oleivorans TaxID=2487129 RepID=UPI000F8E87DB|nr:hypothetical protein [Frigidibacter oleivorans]
MRVQIANFKGEMPRLHPRLLPENYAQAARDIVLEDGAIRALREPVTVHQFPGPVQRIIRHDSAWLGFDADVDATPGPVATSRLYITGDGAPKMRVDGQTYPLALLPPTDAPTVEILGTVDVAIAEETLFAYTYVTQWGEESPPSPLTEPVLWHSPLQVFLQGFVTPPAGRGITLIRLYRSQTGSSGETALHFVAEFSAFDLSHTHLPLDEPIQEPVPSTDYDAPPAGMRGIIPMPNGMMAAFDGKEVLFCEPYIPHAWPSKYVLTVAYPVVGLVALGSALVVLTTGTPYIIQGTHPESMMQEKVESNLPCVARRGIVDMGYSALYPSPEGIVSISLSGAQVISRELFTADQWTALEPSTFIATSYRGRYLFSHLDGAARRIGAIDTTGTQPFYERADISAEDLHLEIQTGAVFMLQGAEVRLWEAGAKRPYLWRSRLYHHVHREGFGAFKIDTERDGATVTRFYADGTLHHSSDAIDTPGRLPAGKATRWEVEVEGDATISGISFAATIEELLR